MNFIERLAAKRTNSVGLSRALRARSIESNAISIDSMRNFLTFYESYVSELFERLRKFILENFLDAKNV